jgi:hypothetical protein
MVALRWSEPGGGPLEFGERAILAVAQTIVCATEIHGKPKQWLALRETPLPNRD